MSKFKILIEGYAKENSDGSILASPTTTLIESKEKKVLVDPGANSKLLLRKLKEDGLTVDDIDIIFLTHYHPDHILNIRLFPNHPIYDGDVIYEDDKESFFEGVIPETDIEVVPTPGHASELVSLKIEFEGKIYVIASDVFWWMDGSQESATVEDLMNLEDPYVKNEDQLKKSRETVLEIADYIIPGHGKMFKNPKKI